jgi:hypothetical protein
MFINNTLSFYNVSLTNFFFETKSYSFFNEYLSVNLNNQIDSLLSDSITFQLLADFQTDSDFSSILIFSDLITTLGSYQNLTNCISRGLKFNSVTNTFLIPSEFENMGPEFTLLETEIRRRHIKYPHLTREEIFEIMYGMGSASTEMALRMYDD